jgi:hypothetical protein
MEPACISPANVGIGVGPSGTLCRLLIAGEVAGDTVRECHRCVVHLLPGHGHFLASSPSPPKCSVCTITRSTSEHRNDVGVGVVVYVIKLRIKRGLLSVWRNAVAHPSHCKLTKISDVLIKMYLRMGFVGLRFTHCFWPPDFRYPINMRVQVLLSKLLPKTQNYCPSSPDVFYPLKRGTTM